MDLLEALENTHSELADAAVYIPLDVRQSMLNRLLVNSRCNIDINDFSAFILHEICKETN